MAIPIPIPIGVTRVAVVQGVAWKVVACEHCQLRYGYKMQLEGVGEDIDLLFFDQQDSTARATLKAEEAWEKQKQNRVLPVPCPACGHYQEEMAGQLKDDVCINRLQIVGAVAFVASFIPVLIGFPFAWAITAVGAIIAIAILTCGYRQSWNFDPNSGDPEPRKVIGKGAAIWGDELAAALQ